MRSLLQAGVALAGAALSMTVAPFSVLAASPTMSTAPGSAVCGAPGSDLCTPAGDITITVPPIGSPLVVPGGLAAFGLVAGDVVNGFDIITSVASGAEQILFSVDSVSTGLAGSASLAEAIVGEVAADVFFGGTTGAPLGTNLLAIDGDGAPAGVPPSLGLVESPSSGPFDDLAALKFCDAANIMDPGATTIVLFTLAAGSPTLAAIGAGPEDIIVPTGAATPPSVITGSSLGLSAGDVIDAISGTGLISLAPGSPSLATIPAGPADLIEVSIGATPFVAISAASIGLGPTDNVDALELLSDHDGDLVHDLCDNCLGFPNNDQTDLNGDGVGDRCASACPAAAPTGCDMPAKSILQIKDRDGDGAGEKDKISWKYLGGPAQSAGDFGSPVASTGFELCIYSGAALTLSAIVESGGTCVGKPCWRSINNGFKFKDKAAATHGVFNVTLKGHATLAKSKVLFKGKDGALPLSASTLPLPVSTVEVRLINSDNSNCWGADFPVGSVIKNTEEQFKAKTP